MAINLQTRIENDINITIELENDKLILKADYLSVARAKNHEDLQHIEDIYVKVVVLCVKEWNLENTECSIENKTTFFQKNIALAYHIGEKNFFDSEPLQHCIDKFQEDLKNSKKIGSLTLKDHNKALQTNPFMLKKEVLAPPLMLTCNYSYIISIFYTINRTRTVGFSSINPLSFTEIFNYLNIIKMDINEAELQTILHLDYLYLQGVLNANSDRL